ncbi:hypothetical protein V8C86DRAFT_223760 [Haematococcus lacustris]
MATMQPSARQESQNKRKAATATALSGKGSAPDPSLQDATSPRPHGRRQPRQSSGDMGTSASASDPHQRGRAPTSLPGVGAPFHDFLYKELAELRVRLSQAEARASQAEHHASNLEHDLQLARQQAAASAHNHAVMHGAQSFAATGQETWTAPCLEGSAETNASLSCLNQQLATKVASLEAALDQGAPSAAEVSRLHTAQARVQELCHAMEQLLSLEPHKDTDVDNRLATIVQAVACLAAEGCKEQPNKQALPLGSDAELQALQAKVHLLQKQLAASEQDSCVARASAAAAAAANATAHSLGAMQTQLQEVSSAQHSVAELRVQLAQRDSCVAQLTAQLAASQEQAQRLEEQLLESMQQVEEARRQLQEQQASYQVLKEESKEVGCCLEEVVGQQQTTVGQLRCALYSLQCQHQTLTQQLEATCGMLRVVDAVMAEQELAAEASEARWRTAEQELQVVGPWLKSTVP